MAYDNNDIIEIDEKITKHFAEYLVAYFMNSLMGEGEKTNTAISDILSRNSTFNKIHELTPNIDAVFIKKVIAILAVNDDFCEIMSNMQMPKEKIESVIISKIRAYSLQRQNGGA